MRLFLKLKKLISFSGYYLMAVIAANLRIAIDVLTPGLKVKPGFLRVPLETQTDMEVLALSNFVTMTPGTLSLDVSRDGKFLYVHAIYLDDVEKTREAIGKNLQARVLEVLR